MGGGREERVVLVVTPEGSSGVRGSGVEVVIQLLSKMSKM